MFDGLRPHLVELRLRLGISVLSVFLFFIIAFNISTKVLPTSLINKKSFLQSSIL